MNLQNAAEAAGILPEYVDQMEQTRVTPPETQEALLAAMGLDERFTPAARRLPRWLVCTPDASPDLPIAEWRLTLEDGQQTEGRGALHALPIGRHRLEAEGETCWLLCAPPTLDLPPRSWGLIAPLACLRPPDDGGIGSFDDAAALARAVAPLGCAYLGLNPVHAGFLTDPGAFSPYTPSHRRRLSPLYLPTDTAVSPGPLIDFAQETPARLAALEAEFAASDDPAFTAWLTDQDDSLTRFALHQALSERHGPYWADWPADLHDPASTTTQRAAAELADRIRLHQWLQFRAESALQEANAKAKDAGMALGLYLDLAVGTHPHGAETWEDRTSFASGASLGAPPDAFSKDGQNWQLAPFNPHALIDTGFAAFAETLRAQLRFSGALRIDHILGFERAFWVPENGAPGAYVQMPREALLAVARIEAARAGATIIGEDLGNIPKGLRAALEASGILGCRVMIFERTKRAFRAPGRFPEASIASFSTHDLPTWRGWRKGTEIGARFDIGSIEAPQRDAALAARTDEVKAFDRMTKPLRGPAAPDSLVAMTRALASAGSRLAAVQVEDILGLEDQPNLPGTTTEYPNWRQRLPMRPKEIATLAAFRSVAADMKQQGR
ncbi:4-alpha-glucanotransferase [Aestuariicoccus sp. MJ-SS9]|uniref:4-alpha-glucanotransferase n=1 Tax=Aestuariicoccus sp. MJ-SS9 TaxID=3079855 RepID=UPI002914202A|nr:4-alpha-glucanotransferase [Aestuariicoccus sp. MJ-SS9]MDU8910653.1 4-alpha-glucanotransferase [Aestuariicoccus sp. MJ-SS9]